MESSLILNEDINTSKYFNEQFVKGLSHMIYIKYLRMLKTHKSFSFDVPLNRIYNSAAKLKRFNARLVSIRIICLLSSEDSVSGLWNENKRTVSIYLSKNRNTVSLFEIYAVLLHELYHVLQAAFIFGTPKVKTGYTNSNIDYEKKPLTYYSSSSWEFKPLIISILGAYGNMISSKQFDAKELLNIILQTIHTKGSGVIHRSIAMMKSKNEQRYNQFLKELYKELVNKTK